MINENRVQNFERLRVAIQGGYGAFHEIAARKYFKDTELEIIPCDTFIDLFESAAGETRTLWWLQLKTLLPVH
jgi:protein involved in sex pheromone biosynthesis